MKYEHLTPRRAGDRIQLSRRGGKEEDMKTIIIYYSRSGATEALAQLIARLTGGELCRV